MAAAMQNALEEGRALLETADRQRRSAEQELADTNENLADLGNVNQSIAAAKRKLESEFNQLGGDLEDLQILEMSTNLSLLQRGSWNLSSTSWEVIWKICRSWKCQPIYRCCKEEVGI